jgi:glycosyltransferase involved in cell wall biosynthesis
MLIGLTRVRNEELIIEDTIKHMLKYVPKILVFDDASEDTTAEICKSFKEVTVYQGTEWSTNRQWMETAHRHFLLEEARKQGAEWCLYMDADERLVGDLPSLDAASPNGYRFKLYDGYMTNDYKSEYISGDLSQLPRMWGPECREILMLFRVAASRYMGLDQREPVVSGGVSVTQVFVKHYGKCISVDQWEETCDYYATYFPEPYKSKWESRRGKAIHTLSDFGAELVSFEELMR